METKTKFLKVQISELKNISVNVLSKGLSISLKEAEAIFNQFLFSELSNKKTHGLIRIPWLLSKKLSNNTKPTPKKINNFITHFDCSKSIGYLAADEIGEYLNQKQQKQNFHIAVGHNIFPTGVLGYYAQNLMKGNLALVFGTTPNLVKVANAKEKILGTNPFAIGFSYGKDKHFLVDMATAPSSFGELLAARYGLSKINQKQYSTARGAVPAKIEDLFDNNNQFTGAILQNLDLPDDFKHYSLMLLVQLMTEMISQNKTKTGDLVFVVLKKEVFGTGKVFMDSLKNLEKKLKPNYLPGMHSTRLFNLNKTRKTIIIPAMLWQELKSL